LLDNLIRDREVPFLCLRYGLDMSLEAILLSLDTKFKAIHLLGRLGLGRGEFLGMLNRAMKKRVKLLPHTTARP
jgi:hypothetical protein